MERGSYALQYPLPDVNRGKLTADLSRFTERFINEDGSVTNAVRHDSRFLETESWHAGMFRDIEQFKESAGKAFFRINHVLRFTFPTETLNLEIRFIAFHKLFSGEWSLTNLFSNHMNHLSLFTRFICEKHPDLTSLLDLDIEDASAEWTDWLEQRGICMAA